MLLHRAFTLIVLLIGVGFGLLLPRPWVEVPEAEAARATKVLCLGTGAVVHNLNSEPIDVQISFFEKDGDYVGSHQDNGLPPGYTVVADSFAAAVGMSVTTTRPARVLGRIGTPLNPVGYSECVKVK